MGRFCPNDTLGSRLPPPPLAEGPLAGAVLGQEPEFPQEPPRKLEKKGLFTWMRTVTSWLPSGETGPRRRQTAGAMAGAVGGVGEWAEPLGRPAGTPPTRYWGTHGAPTHGAPTCAWSSHCDRGTHPCSGFPSTHPQLGLPPTTGAPTCNQGSQVPSHQAPTHARGSHPQARLPPMLGIPTRGAPTHTWGSHPQSGLTGTLSWGSHL